jgi:hypothetical protein
LPVARLKIDQAAEVKDGGKPVPGPFAAFSLPPVPSEHLTGRTELGERSLRRLPLWGGIEEFYPIGTRHYQL